MKLSVLIPSYGRPHALRQALRSLCAQSGVDGEFEVLIGLDGGTPEEVDSIRHEFAGSFARLVVRAVARSGLAAVRNEMIREARGELLLSLNDDVIASERLIAEHLEAHAEFGTERSLVVGAADWKIHPDDTVFDRLIRETSMIFFYSSMNSAEHVGQPKRDWGFRHAWTINLSMRMDDVRTLGGYTVFDSWYGFEDLELAFRASCLPGGRPVRYRPDAHVIHDHRVGLSEYLEREYKLGYNAVHFARRSPEAARATFGRDVTRETELDYSKEFVNREKASSERARTLLETIGAQASDQPNWEMLKESIYIAHLPLKRRCWRLGLIDCCEGLPLDSVRALDQSV